MPRVALSSLYEGTDLTWILKGKGGYSDRVAGRRPGKSSVLWGQMMALSLDPRCS